MAIPTDNCIIQRPDPRQLWNSISSKFSSIVLGGGDVIPESNEWYAVALNFAMAEEFYAYADQLYKETDPRTACCENLIEIAADWGMYPLPATFAEGYVKLKGIPYSRLVEPIEIDVSGIKYRSIGRVPHELNGFGFATVRFISMEAGPNSNLGATTTGRLTTAMAGVNREVEIFGGQFCGGAPEESCEQFRQRFLARMAYRPRATHDWLVEKLLEWPCVTRVCDRSGECCEEQLGEECACVNCRENTGNDFYVMLDSTFECGAAPDCVLQEIQEWMFGPSGLQGRGMGQAPIGVCGRIHAVRIARFDLSIDVHDCLTPNQVEEIEAALRGYFGTICPSQIVAVQSISTTIGQVLGAYVKFDIHASIDTETERSKDLQIDICGDLIPKCDVIPCLRDIKITSPSREEFPCYS